MYWIYWCCFNEKKNKQLEIMKETLHKFQRVKSSSSFNAKIRCVGGQYTYFWSGTFCLQSHATSTLACVTNRWRNVVLLIDWAASWMLKNRGNLLHYSCYDMKNAIEEFKVSSESIFMMKSNLSNRLCVETQDSINFNGGGNCSAPLKITTNVFFWEEKKSTLSQLDAMIQFCHEEG